MSSPPAPPETPKPKLTWYQHVWLGLPLALIAVGGAVGGACGERAGAEGLVELLIGVGGAVGGACGGPAWAINQSVFRKTEHPVLRYVLTGLISVAAVVAYLVLASIFFELFRKKA